MATQSLTQDRLQEVLHYDPETGIFSRLESYQKRFLNTKAGHVHSDGYVIISIDSIDYRAHRLAWFYMTGSWPENEIDHFDHDKKNNVWTNLRDATHSENQQNKQKAHSHNKLGLRGVYFHKQKGKFRAAICINGERLHLGTFSDPQIAHEAYLAAKKNLHPFGAI